MILPPMLGLEIVPTYALVEWVQVRFSKRKKKRIVKKFRKNPRNYAYRPQEHMYLMGNKLLCHPDMAPKIKALLDGGTLA